MKSALEKGKLQEAASLLWDLIGSDKLDKQQPNITELLSRGRIDEAIAQLKKGIAADPHNPTLHKNMAMAMILKEKFEEALFWLDEALWADPKGDAEIFFHRGNILQKLEQHQEALTCYEKAVVYAFGGFKRSANVPRLNFSLGLV
jgi:adenylate cyclase